MNYSFITYHITCRWISFRCYKPNYSYATEMPMPPHPLLFFDTCFKFMTFETVLTSSFLWRESCFLVDSRQASKLWEELRKKKFSGLSFYDSCVSCLSQPLFLSLLRVPACQHCKLMKGERICSQSSSCLLMWIHKAKCNKDWICLSCSQSGG